MLGCPAATPAPRAAIPTTPFTRRRSATNRARGNYQDAAIPAPRNAGSRAGAAWCVCPRRSPVAIPPRSCAPRRPKSACVTTSAPRSCHAGTRARLPVGNQPRKWFVTTSVELSCHAIIRAPGLAASANKAGTTSIVISNAIGPSSVATLARPRASRTVLRASESARISACTASAISNAGSPAFHARSRVRGAVST